jgi:RNA polymerase sigma-70 factor (ECF subfamily)
MVAVAEAVRDDFQLLEAWRGGDEAAGRELFARYFDAVYRFFRNKIDDAAEDLVQQTFMGLVQGKDKFRGDASFRTYVFMIARKRLYTFLRDRDRARDPLEFHSTSIADLGLVSPSRAVAVRQEQQLLLQALRRLPLEMQVALELFYWEELSVTEIADVLETPVGTVKSRLQRARVRLDEILVHLSESDEALLKSTMDNFEVWAKDLQAQMAPRKDS